MQCMRRISIRQWNILATENPDIEGLSIFTYTSLTSHSLTDIKCIHVRWNEAASRC
jgi:hypothetical protein